MDVQSVECSGGSIEYRDSGGDGPVLLFVHGLMMDSTLWTKVIDDLDLTFRCIAPTLPMGAHRQPMSSEADVSLPGLATMLLQVLDRLDLQEVTLIGNDTGGAIVQLVAARAPARVSRIVLVSCEAFDNLPPGLTGRTLALAGRLPPALFGLFMQQLRLRPVRRLPCSFGWLTRRGDAVVAGWLKPLLTSAEIRRDAVRMLRAVFAERSVLLDAATGLSRFARPALVVWARNDRVMPPEHGRRLTALLPDARLVEIDDSYTLIPLDQPYELSTTIRDFVLA